MEVNTTKINFPDLKRSLKLKSWIILVIGIVALALTIIAYLYAAAPSTTLFRGKKVSLLQNKAPDDKEIQIVVRPFFQLPTYPVEVISMTSLVNKSLGGIKIAIHPKGDLISDEVRKSGFWEESIAETVINLIRTHRDAQFVDIGANIGVHSLQVASLGNKVVAVEANRRSCELLSKSLEENGWKDRVTILNHVLDKKRNKEQLVGNNTGTANDSRRTDVTTILFEDLITVLESKTVIMEINFQGTTSQALLSAKKFFEAVNVPALIMEWTKAQDLSHQAESLELITFFYSRNYAAYDGIAQHLLLRSDYAYWPTKLVWIQRKSS